MAQPAYLDVYNQIKDKILQDVYPALSFLPIEPELERTYQVSRTTIRKAMKLLAEEGFIEIRQGRGTMVLDRKASQNFNYITSVTESLRNQGYHVTTKSCYIDKLVPESPIMQKLNLKENQMTVRVQRVQLVDGQPICIMTNYIPEDLVSGMEKEKHTFTGLYEFLEEKYNFIIDSTDTTISAAAADFSEAQILNVDPGFPLLIIQRTCYDSYKRPICVDKVRILSNRYKVQITTPGRNK